MRRPVDGKGMSVSIEKELTSLPFFNEFPANLLNRLALASRIETYEEGSEILKQGEQNQNLFILLGGQVEIVVDGARVAVLNRRGDLLGEMSMVSHQPIAATIRAVVETKLLIVQASLLSSMSESEHELFGYALYRLYSKILAEKLRATNQKAKFFEITNEQLRETQEELKKINSSLEEKVVERTAMLESKTEDLIRSRQKLESQNAELILSHRKLEELYTSKSLTFRQLEELYKDHLLPLQEQFAQMASQTQGDQGLIASASHNVAEVIKLLKPITELYRHELTMRSKRVLLAESDRKQQMVAKLALAGSGVELEIATTREEVAEKLARNVFDVAFVNEALLDTVMGHPEMAVVLLVSGSMTPYVSKLRGLKTLPNLVSYSPDDRVFTIKNIMTTVTKLTAQDFFGPQKYLSWGAEIQSYPVRSSGERAELEKAMSNYLVKLGIRSTLRERAGLVLEEMLMNAIYDAPVGADGEALYNHLPRTTPVELAPGDYATLRYGCDGMVLAVAVEDRFGALSGSTTLHYLETCYNGEAGSLNKNKGGAGRGLHQIIECSDLVVFNIHSGRRTEVIALFDIDPKAQKNAGPSFHFFIR